MTTNCITSPCAKTKKGYGHLYYEGICVYHHRLVYCTTHNLQLSAIEGKVVMHTCDNPSCVNPEHLVLGTQSRNIQDMHIRGRANLASVKGINNPRAIVTESMVREIRARFKSEEASKIAKDLGLKLTTIYSVTSGRNWKHII